jgi:hypothetical protein
VRIISKNDLRVVTTHGAIALFHAGVEKQIGDEVGRIALQMGATEIRDNVEVISEEVPETIEEGPIDLLAVMEQLIERGDPKDFKKDGSPKASAVNREAKRTIQIEEREHAWAEVLNN